MPSDNARPFLAEGKWDEAVMQSKVKTESLRHVVQESKQIAEPLFFIHDDTIAKKTKPSSASTVVIQKF